MKQKFKVREEEPVINKDSLKQQFDDARQKKIKKADTKIVNVKVQIGCGCGGSYGKYNIEVPIDSNIKNGQYFSDFDEDWKNVKEGWV